MTVRVSKCASPNQPPLQWHAFREDDGTRTVDIEIAAVATGKPPAERIARFNEVRTRLEAAMRGDLTYEDELKDIERDPELWEIRWSFRGEEWRLYHAEPVELPTVVVGLRFHEKDVSTRDTTVMNRQQNAEIATAQRRHMVGRPWSWGYQG